MRPRAAAAPTPFVATPLEFSNAADDDGGGPRFQTPLPPPAATAAAGARQALPLLLYLPGIDGTGLAASRQFPSLLRRFDMRTFVVPPGDRTPFEGLVRSIVDYLK